jgi:hypothetical protein
MLDYIKNPDTWMTVIAVLISVIALLQTAKQTKLSNKQQLFDRRLEKYLFVKDLLILYKDNRALFVSDESICEMVDFQFIMLTNCSSLEKMGAAISTPLHDDIHKEYLTKIEMLDKNATEIELLWNTKEGRLVGRFVKQYKDLIHSMYKQQIWINHLNKINTPESPLSLDEFKKQAKEKACEIGLFDIIEDIDNTYNEIIEKDVEQHIIKSIRL